MSYAYTTPDRAQFRKRPAPSSWVSWKSPLAEWYEDALLEQLFALAEDRWEGPVVSPVVDESASEGESCGPSKPGRGGACGSGDPMPVEDSTTAEEEDHSSDCKLNFLVSQRHHP